MSTSPINILSIAPYQFLPIVNGGQHAISKLHHHIGLSCNDHIVTTDDNEDNTRFSFTLHKVFPDKPFRFLPGYGMSKMMAIARSINCTHIISEHPFMAITAMMMARRLKVPWYIRSHNIESERFRALGKKWWPILRKYESYTLNSADGIFFITQEDMDWAQQQFKLSDAQCYSVPFGTDLQNIPGGHDAAKKQIAADMGINADVPWLYFLGALDYPPNEDAVRYIVEEVQPRMAQKGISCEILIAGKGLCKELYRSISSTANMHYMGFVPDLHDFLNACDVMLNPVLKGGGVKTKAVEAIGYNKTVVSSVSGAAGLMPDVCGKKLRISADGDWNSYTDNIITAIDEKEQTPQLFYDTYYHGSIAEKVVDILKKDAR